MYAKIEMESMYITIRLIFIFMNDIIPVFYLYHYLETLF